MKRSSKYKGISFLLRTGGMQCWPFYLGDISLLAPFFRFQIPCQLQVSMIESQAPDKAEKQQVE